MSLNAIQISALVIVAVILFSCARAKGQKRRLLLSWFVGLLSILLLAEAGARILEPRLPTPPDYFSPEASRLIEEMKRSSADKIQTDILAIGSSQAGHDFVPAVLKSSLAPNSVVHNASLAKGGETLMMHRWLFEEVLPRLHPQRIIWGISSLDFNSSLRDQSIDRYNTVRASRPGMLGTLDRDLASFSALARNRASLRDPNTVFEVLGGSDLSSELPIRPRNRAITFTPGRTKKLSTADRRRMLRNDALAASQGPLRSFHIGDAEIAAFRRTIRELKAHKIPVQIVIMPVQQGYLDAHPNGESDYNEWRQKVTSAAKAEGVQIMDHTDSSKRGEFLDLEHLNGAGARRFSLEIASELKRRGW